MEKVIKEKSFHHLKHEIIHYSVVSSSTIKTELLFAFSFELLFAFGFDSSSTLIAPYWYKEEEAIEFMKTWTPAERMEAYEHFYPNDIPILERLRMYFNEEVTLFLL